MRHPVKWPYGEDRCYHGIDGSENTRIFVERPAFKGGDGKVVEELKPLDPRVTFSWGYLGSGPNASARAILKDALGDEPSDRVRLAFTEDFLAHCGKEFKFRRGAILRWARGLYAQMGRPGEADVPAVLAMLPPVDRTKYEPRAPGGS